MHTPGPWVATLEKWHAYVDAVKYGATLAKVDGDGGMVDVYQPANETPAGEWYEMSTEERDANARLIAAAPDLFEALEKIMDYRTSRQGDMRDQPERHFRGCRSTDNYDGGTCDCGGLEAERALAKATGK